MKLVFVTNSMHFTKYQYPIGVELKKKGVDIVHVSYSKECVNFLKERGEKVYYIPDDFKNAELLPLLTLEKTYGFKKEDMLRMDYDITQKGEKKAYKILEHNFRFWRELLKRETPTMLITSSERYVGIVPYYACKGTNTRYYYWTRFPLPDRFIPSALVSIYNFRP